jgi:hypothetical protein
MTTRNRSADHDEDPESRAYAAILKAMPDAHLVDWSEVRAELAAAFAAKLERSRPTVDRIPRLTPRAARKYIAAVADAVKVRAIEPAQANAMLYSAQLLLAAHKAFPPKPRAESGRPAHKKPLTLNAARTAK